MNNEADAPGIGGESDRSPILVTGTAGFIGFHVARALLKRGRRVVGVDNFNSYYAVMLKEARSRILREDSGFVEERGDIADLDFVTRVAHKHKPALICHLAAQAGVRYSLTNPFVYETSNVQGTLNLLEIARHLGIRRFVYASSSSVYGGNVKLPFSETDRVDSPISLYAATKRSNELMAHVYSRLFGIRTVGLRFFTVYGPWGRPDMAMWIFVESILAGKPIPIFNNGRMRRDFTYIDDIVAGVEAALFAEGLEDCEVINLGNSRPEDLMALVALLEKALGRKAEIRMLPMQPGDVEATCADISRARAKLGFEPRTPLSEGVPKFVEWYLAHPEIAAEVARTRE
ncbi:MAG: GDP-mannose 4,6-dehydratase [Planctomycetota bacterium]|nr:GDP-mannose 4,6-dehydratase [Planctomycetota bacterium]